ncbi:MAG: biopolymer transport protein ExbD [Chthoniobacter sp.]|jgi:biopolymer transport protein ExbD|nr:biopolymer transport protein ExbD [Chthoniobacter sp.]
MRVKKTPEESFEINLIPMIDCMLVIIIFFLVATTMKNREKELPLDLPEANAALQVEQPPDLFIIGVDRAGVPYLSTGDFIESVDTERLHQRVREVAAADPSRRVRIDGDRATRFEDIIRVVDLCQFEGLKNVGLHTKSNPGR